MQPAFPPPLCEEVILALIINQTVEVVNPTFLFRAWIQPIHGPLAGAEVELRAQRLLVKRLGYDRQPLWFIGLNNLIDVNMSPPAACHIYDLHLCVLAHKSAHIPTGRRQTVASPASRTAQHFPVNEQVHTGVTFVIASTNAKGEVFPDDSE